MTLWNLAFSGARLRAALGGFVALGLYACGGAKPTASDRAPRVTPADRLDLLFDEAEATQFQVISAAPMGPQTGTDLQVNVVFNKPLRAATLAEEEVPPGIRIEPPLAGKWAWVGTNGVTWVPADTAVRSATTYRVTVPQGLRSLEGSALATPFAFEFETPRPEVTGIETENADYGLTPKSRFSLNFSLPVTKGALAEALKVVAVVPERPEPLPLSVDIQPDKEDPFRLWLTPKEPLPLDAVITISVEKGLRSEEGPLLSSERWEEQLRTYGRLAARFECEPSVDACVGRPRLVFNNNLSPTALRNAVQITPDVGLRVLPTNGESEPSEVFELKGRYEQGVRYRVSLRAGAKDIHGQNLAQGLEAEFQMGPGIPLIELGANSGFIEPSQGSKVLISSTNVKGFGAIWLPLTPEQVMAYRHLGTSSLPPMIFQREPVSPNGRLNRQHNFALSFERALGGRGGGALLVGHSSADAEGKLWENFQLIHPTNLTVTSQLSAAGGLAWVTRLSDGRPVPNVKLRFASLRGNVEQRFVTDAGGVATIPADALKGLSDEPTPLLVAETADDWSYTPVSGLLPYQHRTLIALSTERELYRPGEEVHVKGWLRSETRTGTLPLSAKSVVIELKDGANVEQRAEVKTNAFGGFNTTFKIPAFAALGEHFISVEAEGESDGRSITVGEYRPTEFNAQVTVARKEHLRGEPIAANFQGTYLFGGAMKEAAFEYFGTPSFSDFQPPGSGSFTTNAWAFSDALTPVLALPPLSETGSVQAVLDGQGAASGQLSPLFHALGAVRLNVVATVRDVTRQAVSAGDETLIHPGHFYVGLELPKITPKPKEVLRPNVIALTSAGQRLAAQKITLELYSYRPYYYRSADNDTPVKQSSCTVVSAEAAVSCGLTLKQAGYHFVLARAVDALKNPLYAASGLYVEGDPGGYTSDFSSDDLRIDLDKPHYAVGDTARVTVTAPFADADVLLMLEQEGVLWFEQQRAKGNVARFQVPVTASITRNATLTAQTARGPRPVPKDPGQGTYRPYGSEPTLLTASSALEIDVSAQQLKVHVLPERESTTPGGQVKVRFQVRDGLGRPHAAELAVAAVDEGVLMLTAYQSPNPFDVFTQLRDSAVVLSDSRSDMGWLFEPQLEEMAEQAYGQGFGAGHGRLGGSHAARAPKIRMGMTSVSPRSEAARADFRTTPYFNPSIVTDAEGNAEVTIGLSQLLTRYRITAIASARDDYFGKGEGAIETRSPLMVRPAMPRFTRVGDRFEAGVVVTSSEVNADNVVVTAQASGVTLHGAKEKTLTIRQGESKEVRFAFSSDAPGVASFDFSVVAGGAKDAVAFEIPVKLPLSPQAVALYGKTNDARGEALGNLKAASRNYGELSIATSSTALVGLGEGVDQLIEYPYGCTEQLSSRLLPLLPLRDLANDFGIALPDDLDGEIQSTINQLIARQRYDGGFGLWQEDPESHPWLSAYVLRTLDEAQKRGVTIPEDVLQNAFEYLRRYSVESMEDEFYRPTLAYIAYVFGELERPSRVALERLMIDDKDDAPFVRALLLQALARVQKTRTAPTTDEQELAWRTRVGKHIQKLTLLLEGELRLSGNRAFVKSEPERYRWLFDSSTRTSAMVLSALLEANPKHPLAEAMARGLLAARRDGSWRSTQETAYALLALDSYRRKQEAAKPDFSAMVWLGEAPLGKARYSGRSTKVQGFTVPMAQLPSDGSVLAFQKEGQGTLFYQALLRYSPKELPTSALDHGFSVRQDLYAVQRGPLPEAIERGYAPGQSSFNAGNAVLAQLTISTPTARDFVVIEAPLPAGLEAIDTSFATNSEEGLRETYDVGYGSGWSRRELRDDRVLFFMNRMAPGVYRFSYLARATSSGSFVMPPATAQEMYAPENFGRTGALRIEVQNGQ